MTWQLARRMDGLRASEIRELLKVASDPEMISFAGGLPAKELFPARQLAEAIIALLQDKNKMRGMGERGYARVLEHFTWERVLSKIEPQLYAMLDTKGEGK